MPDPKDWVKTGYIGGVPYTIAVQHKPVIIDWRSRMKNKTPEELERESADEKMAMNDHPALDSKLNDPVVIAHFMAWHMGKYNYAPQQGEMFTRLVQARFEGFQGALELVFAEAKPELDKGPA